jgi:hypothetical protein
MDMSTKRRGHAVRTMALVLGSLMALTVVSPAAAKPAPAATCNVSPGDTTVSWRAYPKTTSITLEWFDASGAMISSVTVVPTNGPPRYTQATPAGAVEFGARYSDASGVFGVIGGTCF